MIASSITPQRVEWLWPGFVPLGKITVVAGQMGQAKSLWTTWLAAHVSQGLRGAIILNAEDDAADTIRPRLEAAGANLDLVWIEPNVELDASRLRQLCEQFDARLIVIDPIQAFLGAQVNSWKGQDVRRALEPIRQLAADCEVAVVLVQHLNRRSDAGDPLARIADSQGIPQLARSVLVWGPDPADPEGDQGCMKALTRAKGNLSRLRASATFSIVERDVDDGAMTAPTLVRGEDREISADDVVSDHETRTAQDEAVEWLRDLLAHGPMAAKEATRKAREDGITERTLRRARKVAGVVSEPARSDSGITGWNWRLESPDALAKDDGHVGPLGHLGSLPQTQAAKAANMANTSKGSTLSLVEATDEEERRLAALEAKHGAAIA